MGLWRYLKPALIILAVLLLFFLIHTFGPWDMRVPAPFIRFFLMVFGGLLALTALSVLFSWLADAKNRRAKRDLEFDDAVPVTADNGGDWVIEETYVVEPQQTVEIVEP